MNKRNPLLCKDCRSCLWVFDYESESQLLFCDNPLTKNGDISVGFLSHAAEACKYFEDALAEPGDTTTTPQREWFLMVVNH
jgi:hypothetical protein